MAKNPDMDGTTLATAALSGLAVLAVTWLADRLGGTLGGLLATAPITTAAAVLFLSREAGGGAVADQLLRGSLSLVAALAGLPAYFYTLKATGSWPLWVRIPTGLVVFLVIFTGGTLLLDVATPVGLGWLGIPVVLLLATVLAGTFLRARIPATAARTPKSRMTAVEGVFRFLAGAGVILLIAWLRNVDPVLGAAWSVFPGTLLVTLGVLGFGHGAAFSARAAQGGILGAPSLVAYLLVLRILMPLSEHTLWPLAVQVPAWIAYFGTLYPLFRWRRRGVAAPSASTA